MSDDLRVQFDRMIDGANRLSRLEAIHRMKVEADHTDRRECGNCEHWLKSRECPREHNVNGMSRGPSMSAPACSKFVLKPWVAELKQKRLAEIELALSELEHLP